MVGKRRVKSFFVTSVPVPFDRFKTIDKIKSISCPILIIHGRDDHVVKFWHGEELQEAAHEPKQFLWVDNAGHGDVSTVAREQYERAIKKFVAQIQTSAKIFR